tara:strand:+ start:2567 stop:4150 length:1584 start_codon:yes stop_codon:yes gene_type:complete
MSVTGKTKGGNAPILSVGYIMGDGSCVSQSDLQSHSKLTPMSKALTDSTTSTTVDTSSKNPFNNLKNFAKTEAKDVVSPPFDPNLLAKFIDVDETHSSSSRVKITDAMGRGFRVGLKDRSEVTEEATSIVETELVNDFIRNCNSHDGFIGTFTQAGIDFESVGWGAIEVVRSMDMRVKKIQHVSAPRILVQDGWFGFTEELETGKKLHYQNFGDKVVSKTRVDIFGDPEPFDLSKDGSWANAEWNLRDWESFNQTNDLSRSANEILYIPKYHPKSVYYGVPDYIPAVGAMIGNINIRDYFLQFFDHNAVPQYAVIVKGADLSQEVKNLIQGYFSRDVKGSAHKTLVIPIPAVGEIDVVFEKLDANASGDEYNNIRRANQDAIMVAHGVSAAIIGLTDTASLGSGKGTAQMENYRERIVIPYQLRWSSEMNSLFEKGLGVYKVGVIFDPLSTEDRSVLLKDDIEAMNNGLLTINNVRERNNLGPPISEGDRLFINTGSGPVFLDELTSTPETDDAINQLKLRVTEDAA